MNTPYTTFKPSDVPVMQPVGNDPLHPAFAHPDVNFKSADTEANAGSNDTDDDDEDNVSAATESGDGDTSDTSGDDEDANEQADSDADKIRVRADGLPDERFNHDDPTLSVVSAATYDGEAETASSRRSLRSSTICVRTPTLVMPR
jgi:hypothetical protein